MLNEQVLQELIQMGLSNEHEATDMLIALYPNLSRSQQAGIITLIKDHYNGTSN